MKHSTAIIRVMHVVKKVSLVQIRCRGSDRHSYFSGNTII